MKRYSFLMLFIASLYTNLFAQVPETTEPESPPTTFGFQTPTFDSCTAPTNILTAVVYTDREARAYLEFTSEYPFDRVSILDESSAERLGDFKIERGQLLLTNLETGKKYQLFATDQCGKEVVVAEIDTKIEKRAVFPASPSLFAELTAHVNSRSPEPLNEFLANNEKVSYMERLAYFQQHLLQGQPFDEFPIENSFPDVPRSGFRSAACSCTFVINTIEYVAPGTQTLDISDNTQRQGHITGQNTNSGNSWNDPKESYEDNSRFWWYRISKGPSKWHQLWSEGHHAGSESRETKKNDIDQNGTNVSAHFAQLQYSFFCTNWANLPAECACERKPIHLDWRYDTRATAFANIGGGVWERHAASASQDVAIVTYEELGPTNTIEIFGAGTVKVKAECQKEVNDDFWLKAAEVAGGIAVIVAATNGTPIQLSATQITSLATNLGQLLNTPISSSTGCNVQTETANVLTKGTREKTIKPNRPIRMICSSFSNLEVLGKRSWFSWGRIHSSFQINGVIKGGLLGNEENYCCTKTVGNWVATSMESPDLTQQFEDMVGIHFSSYFYGMPVQPSGAILLQKEFGYITQSAHPGCEVIGINPNNDFTGGGSDDRGLQNNPTVETRFEIHDPLGKLVFSGRASGLSKSNLSQFVAENGLIATPGIYMVSLANEQGRESWKVYLQ